MEETNSPQPSHTGRNVTLSVIVILAAVALVYFLPHKTTAPTNYAQVHDFESCAQAGLPITESDPATCHTPDGKTFTETQPSAQADVVVNTPQPVTLVTNPLQVSGQAVGSWFFEGTFPAVVKDSNGNILGQGPMTAQSNWMTTTLVPFSGTITFFTPQTATGFLILSKDNPSGDPNNDSSIAVPIKFQ